MRVLIKLSVLCFAMFWTCFASYDDFTGSISHLRKINEELLKDESGDAFRYHDFNFFNNYDKALIVNACSGVYNTLISHILKRIDHKIISESYLLNKDLKPQFLPKDQTVSIVFSCVSQLTEEVEEIVENLRGTYVLALASGQENDPYTSTAPNYINTLNPSSDFCRDLSQLYILTAIASYSSNENDEDLIYVKKTLLDDLQNLQSMWGELKEGTSFKSFAVAFQNLRGIVITSDAPHFSVYFENKVKEKCNINFVNLATILKRPDYTRSWPELDIKEENQTLTLTKNDDVNSLTFPFLKHKHNTVAWIFSLHMLVDAITKEFVTAFAEHFE